MTKQFDDYSEAFDWVREGGKPEIVEMVAPASEPGRYKMFPSGCAQRLLTSAST